VTPGSSCTSSADCASGQYCETALGGTSDAGIGETGPGCTASPPQAGRCLELPTVCPAGTDAGPDAGCVAACEVHPTGTGALNAVVKWHWGDTVTDSPDDIDIWSTPTVARVVDLNCDGKLDALDPPTVVFVSGNVEGTCCQCNGKTPTACHTGVLRAVDGANGETAWSLDKAFATSVGFAGTSVALGDIDGDGRADIVAVTGEGYVVVVGGDGKVKMQSDKPIAGGDTSVTDFGWGGGLAIADMDGDGSPEIAYGSTVFTTVGGALKLKFAGTATETQIAMSTFVDIDGKPGLELVTGRAAYAFDGTVIWTRADLNNGFPAIADMDGDGVPDIIVTHDGKVEILTAATGVTKFGPSPLPGTGSGGPPTIADFTGDKVPEIGVAMQTFYSVLKPNMTTKALDIVWQQQSHDLSSSVTGSSVFDFEGDGRAEVVYNDECYLWVYDGPTGKVRYAGLTSSFTGTEASLVADIDGDGHADMLMIANGVDPGATGWKCNIAPWNTADPTTGRPAWTPPAGGKYYRGLTALQDSADAWVGTRTIWSEHTYHVTNICDDRDSACVAPNVYGSIPKVETANWTLPWLNDFRQNVEDQGIFDAADAVVALSVACTDPPTLTATLRNIGLAGLPANVHVGLYVVTDAGDTKLGEVVSTNALLPGQSDVMTFTVTAGAATSNDTFDAKVLNDPAKPTFVECNADNDDSGPQRASCVH
jgi:hypothetical protein